MSKHIDYEINRELGECYLFMGEFDKAADYYQKALDCGTDADAPYLGLATVAVQRGNLDEAKIYYEKAASLTLTDKALAGLGLIEMDLGQETEAFGHFLEALKHNPSNMIAINALIQLGYKLSRLEETLPKLEAFLSINDNETVRFTLAGCLSYLGRPGEARGQLEILLDRNPGNIGAQELYASIAA